jgi:phospholipid/cholesterol/gamma-HCH transport system permease protein
LDSDQAPLLKRIGLRAIEFWDFCVFIQRTFKHYFPPYPRFSFFYRQFIEVGIKSIPIVLVVGAFVGMVLAVMTYQQFSTLGIESMMGPFIAVPMVSQLGPIMTALMILCRVGSAMTAELGSMRVTEQIDALHCFGINPIRTLIVPRTMICALMLPALTVLSDVIGIIGGWVLGVYVFEINESYYLEKTRAYFQAFDVYTGLFKAFVFGFVISLFCCFKGYYTKGGASGVGKSIMEAVVVAFIAIIVLNFAMSLISSYIWHNFLGGAHG